jgi:hypothetical protein
LILYVHSKNIFLESGLPGIIMFLYY